MRLGTFNRRKMKRSFSGVITKMYADEVDAFYPVIELHMSVCF